LEHLAIDSVMSERKRIKLENIDLIVYDFDGVMTNNKVLVFEDGKEAVYCDRSDGLAIAKIKDLSVSQVIISTEKKCSCSCAGPETWYRSYSRSRG